MNRQITFTLDDDLAKKIPDNMMIDDLVLNKAIDHYLASDKQGSTSKKMVKKTKMKLLEEEKTRIEQEKNSLEIDFACLKQQNQMLESRIDDLAELYPSASILLGKKPNLEQTKRSFLKNMILKRK